MNKLWLLQGVQAIERIGKAELDKRFPVYGIESGKEFLLAEFQRLDENYKPGQTLFIVLRGELKIHLPNHAGGRTMVAHLKTGDIFGESETDGAPPTELEVIGKLEVYPIRREQVDALFASRHALFESEKRFLTGLKRRRVRANPLDYLFMGPIEKIATWLAEAATDQEAAGAPLEPAMVAEMTAESPVRTLAALALFKKRGLLNIQKKKIEIVSPEGLLRFSKRYRYHH